MKTLIILVLTLALAAAAFFTRPSQADFKRYVVESAGQSGGNIFQVGWDRFRAEQFANNCEFHDRLLWVDVQKGGKTVYTGAFGHWFNRAALADEMKRIEQTAGKSKT